MNFALLNNRLTMYMMTMKPGMKTRKSNVQSLWRHTSCQLLIIPPQHVWPSGFPSPPDCTWKSGDDMSPPSHTKLRLCPTIVWVPWILSSNLAGKELRHWAKFCEKLHDFNFSRFVTIHSRYRWTCRQTDKRQTTYYDNSRTLLWNCNVRLKTQARPD